MVLEGGTLDKFAAPFQASAQRNIRNWIATVTHWNAYGRPSDRIFWDRTNVFGPQHGRYRLPLDLKPGDIFECATDRCEGKQVFPSRKFFQVLEIQSTHLIVKRREE